MATIKALEGRTVHQIQSGQVIVDLCSVAKELVENSLDAGATSIEIRFRNNGLDSIEVQDNGGGILAENYETIALKHYTSKLSNYDDLDSLQTFGFRGEALSSLCALSQFHIVTAREDEAPKGTRLDFEVSGKLKSTSVVASHKGTTVSIESLFHNLPVRRRELQKNIKREYGKVLGILQAYACISTQANITVSNVMSKGKKAVVFATKSNRTTRDNIASVFGAKTVAGLVAMDMNLEMEAADTALRLESDDSDKHVTVTGHVSRPIFGEGRQAPDRQLFFVNSRPCGLPQVAKVFNEVYKSFNMSQTPFIFANIMLDTNAYDVNVSPDKRTILLHEQAKLLEGLRETNRLPSFKNLNLSREASTKTHETEAETEGPVVGRQGADGSPTDSSDDPHSEDEDTTPNLIGNFAARDTMERVQSKKPSSPSVDAQNGLSNDKQKLVRKLEKQSGGVPGPDDFDSPKDVAEPDAPRRWASRAVDDFNQRLAEHAAMPIGERPLQCAVESEKHNAPLATLASSAPPSDIVQNAFDRMRPRRKSPEVATITIGDKTTTAVLGPSILSERRLNPSGVNTTKPKSVLDDASRENFSSSMQSFAAPGSTGSTLIKTMGPLKSKVGLPQQAQNSYTESSEDEEQASDDVGSEGESREDEEVGASDLESDTDYVDEDKKKAIEEAKVAEMIRKTEEAASMPSEDCKRRAQQALKGSRTKESPRELLQSIEISLINIKSQLTNLQHALQSMPAKDASHALPQATRQDTSDPFEGSAPDSQTLTITKSDFSRLHILGQFNLGFILATRNNTDLFIIDQHASDEKINFERLQATTVMQNQRLVHSRRLELTAVDEEIILENQDALLRNGFIVDVDESGDYPVGQRVSLVSLPMSRETTFAPSDLEELIALLADAPSATTASMRTIPRPTKIRKLLAMRACRSSIMIGKVMNRGMMRRLVSKMGEIDKPWNCPHGRPTMRHVCGLEGIGGEGDEGEEREDRIDWGGWLERMRGKENGGGDLTVSEESGDEETDDGDDGQMEEGEV